MNIGDIGIGLNAGISGFAKGLHLGQTLQGVIDKNKIRRTQKEGMEKAEQERQAEISDMISKGQDTEEAPTTREIPYSSYRTGVDATTGAFIGLPNQPGDTETPIAITGTTRRKIPQWTLDGKTFQDEAKAREYAGTKVKSVADRFYANTVPKIAEQYLQQGNIEKAEAWTKYADTKAAKRYAKEWWGAYSDFRQGKYDKASKFILKGYNEQYDDGFTASNIESVKDENGKQTGFKISLTNDKTGEKTEELIDQDAFMQIGMMGLAGTNPLASFETAFRSHQEGLAKAADRQHDLNKMVKQHNLDKLLEQAKLTLKQGKELNPAQLRKMTWEMMAKDNPEFLLLPKNAQSTAVDNAVYAIMMAAEKPEGGREGGGEGGGGIIPDAPEVPRNNRTMTDAEKLQSKITDIETKITKLRNRIGSGGYGRSVVSAGDYHALRALMKQLQILRSQQSPETANPASGGL